MALRGSYEDRVVCREVVAQLPDSPEQAGHRQPVHLQLRPGLEQPVAVVDSKFGSDYKSPQRMRNLHIDQMRRNEPLPAERAPRGVMAKQSRDHHRRVDDDHRSRPARTALTTSSTRMPVDG